MEGLYLIFRVVSSNAAMTLSYDKIFSSRCLAVFIFQLAIRRRSFPTSRLSLAPMILAHDALGDDSFSIACQKALEPIASCMLGRAGRKPMLLFEFERSLLLFRYPSPAFDVLFQLPPA